MHLSPLLHVQYRQSQMTKFTVTSVTAVTLLPSLILAMVRLGFLSLKFGIGSYDGLVRGCFICHPPPSPS